MDANHSPAADMLVSRAAGYLGLTCLAFILLLAPLAIALGLAVRLFRFAAGL